MCFAPEDRYQNSSELRRDLENLGRHPLRMQKKRWFFRGALCGAGLTAALSLSAFLLFSSGMLSFNSPMSEKSKNQTAENGFSEKPEKIQTGKVAVPNASENQSEEAAVPDTAENQSGEAAVPDTSENQSGEATVPDTSEIQTGETAASNLENQDKIYTFKEPLIERAARVCLNKEDGEPVTVRDLSGIVFIGLYENKILSYFDEVLYRRALPYLSPDDIFDPDNVLPNKLSTLEDLAAMPNLRELSLCNISLDSLEGLNQLHLTSLALTGTGLSDFEVVSTQTDLENLVIIPKEGNLHFDLPFLPEMQKLSSLNICNILFDNGYDFLAQMPVLQNLTVSDLPDDLVEALRKTDVKNLTLWDSYSQLSPPLSKLSGCTSLEEVSLMLSDKPVFFLDDESPSDLPNLRKLTLSGYYYRDFECLSSLEHLEDLVFVGDDVSKHMLDCQNLDKLLSLKQVYCNQAIHEMLEKHYPERTFKLITD